MSCSSYVADVETLTTGSSSMGIQIEDHDDHMQNDDHIKNSGHTNYVPPSPEAIKKFVEDFISHNLNVNNDKLDDICKDLKGKHKIAPSKPDIRRTYDKFFAHVPIPKNAKRWMIKRAVRSQSGVLVATITLSPHKFSCKYDCFYCPLETDLTGKPTQPRSYLSNEPAMLRALQYNFDVRGQFWDRIKAYSHTGNIDASDKNSKKMEVILSGGTWESYPKEYREQVMLELYWAANTYGNDRPPKSLEEEVHENESAMFRIIGLTIETRPDNITPDTLRDYRRWGVTRVQIGVQHYDDTILRKINRGCYTKHTIRAIRLLKQCGFKVVVHLMPDLPGSSPERDKWMFDQAIDRPELQFDDVKIYPTAICKSSNPELIVSSKIADWYKEGSFVPYAERNLNDLFDVLTHYKKRINPWVRIQRLVRDIPSNGIEAGYHRMSNLRQILQERMTKCGEKCHCIRCMEIRNMELENLTPSLVVRKYEASEGMEYHITVEAHQMNRTQLMMYYWFTFVSYLILMVTGKWRYWPGDMNTYVGVFGFLRLRHDPEPGGDIIPELNGCALVREVHVYGLSLGVGTDGFGSQHRGYGQLMMKAAEHISQMAGYTKSAVIAGVGTRQYYQNKCGYHLGETYMLKDLPKFNSYTLVKVAALFMFAAIIYKFI